jgi:hypothetical protein
MYHHPLSILINPEFKLKQSVSKIYILKMRLHRKMTQIKKYFFANPEVYFCDFWALVDGKGFDENVFVLYSKDFCVIHGLSEPLTEKIED